MRNVRAYVLFKMNNQKKSSGETMSETDDSDIIECSIVHNSPVLKINMNQIYSKNQEHTKTTSTKNLIHSANLNSVKDSISLSLKNNFQYLHEAFPKGKKKNFYEKNEGSKTAGFNNYDKNDNNDFLNKIENTSQSSVNKNTNNTPYLSKIKLRNVQQWLQCNDFDKIGTPPFANLSIVSKTTGKKKFPTRKKKNEKLKSISSIDSDVEDVLKAVYGSNWTKKSGGRCKTDPKKLSNNFTPVKIKKKEHILLHSAKRNLLKLNQKSGMSDTENDESIISGIHSIKLDDSDNSSEQSKIRECKGINFKEKGRLKLIETVSNLQKINKNEFDMINTFENQDLINSVSEDRCGTAIVNKTPIKTFLASLSVSTPTSRYHPEADQYKINFKFKKDELIRKLFKLYNANVFDQKLPDDMNFSWNIKLRGTAGYCYNKRITKSSGEIVRVSRIEFSTKIVDRADRLRDTMIHELCHAASWIINGQLDGHGAVWSGWAAKVAVRFPELPKIRRCHNYEILAKYIYKCKNCGYSVKRHSKSINTEKIRCGHCFGTLELFLNKKKRGKREVPEFDMTRTLPTPNKFAIFVKENYRSIKHLKADAKHAEIMKILSEQYALEKNKNNIRN